MYKGKEKVILVDENDRQIGLMEKIEAHEKALLHRAFSVFVFNDKGETLLQQHAANKYHSPGLWTNTCCSHQRDGETNIEAGKRRLHEYSGFSIELEAVLSFIYHASCDTGLAEHEFDHIMVGKFNEEPNVNPDEVASCKWMALKDIKTDIAINPNH